MTLSGNVLESASSEFFVAFVKNDIGGSPTLRLFISSIEPDPVLITIIFENLGGFAFTGIATQNQTATVEIPNTFQVLSSSERDKGIRVLFTYNYNIISLGAILLYVLKIVCIKNYTEYNRSNCTYNYIFRECARECFIGVFVAFGNQGSPAILRLFITSIEPDPVETLRGFNFTGIATPNETTTVEIPNTFEVVSSLDRDKGIRVSAGDKLAVIATGSIPPTIAILSRKLKPESSHSCLRREHLSRDCRSNNRCRICKGRHHTSICGSTATP